MTRLNKYLADCGIGSRRTCDELIASGRIRINKKVVKKLGTLVGEGDEVTFNGRVVYPSQRKVYVLLHKPVGYITSASDNRGRKTVLDLVKVSERIFPVGRLDAETTGLLILTNDGQLAHRLMHPRFKVLKTYRASLDKEIDIETLQRLQQGVVLEDGATLPCKISFWTKSHTEIKVVLREGRKRQVRRMFEACGYNVQRLSRIQFGPLKLGGVKRGNWRFLNNDEIKKLKQIVGLGESNKI